MDEAGCIRVIPFQKSACPSSYRLARDNADDLCILQPVLESSDEQASLSDGPSHPGRFDDTIEKENRKTSIGSAIPAEEVEFLWKLRKYLLLLAILAASVTYSAGLSPPGGFWPDTEMEDDRCHGINKQFKDPRYWVFLAWMLVITVSCIWLYQFIANETHIKARSAGAITLKIAHLCTLLNLPKAVNFYFCGSDSMIDKDNTATWEVGSASTHHVTGNRALLFDFKTVDNLNIQTGDGRPMLVTGRGSVRTDMVVLPDVWFAPELKKNIVSVSQLAELDCSIVFKRDACYISDATDGTIIGKALVGENGTFKLEFLKVPLDN